MCNGQLIDTRILAIGLLLYLPVLLTSPAACVLGSGEIRKGESEWRPLSHWKYPCRDGMVHQSYDRECVSWVYFWAAG